MNINEDIMSDVAEQFDINYSTLIQFEEFQMYYFEVFQ